MNLPTSTSEDFELARGILQQRLGGGGGAMLTTVSPEGRPHATWMGTLGAHDFGEIVTITSPGSEKVRNIKSNSRVEWLFTGPDRRALVYLEGAATIIEDVVEIKRYWEIVNDKEEAFFLQYFNTGIGFSILRTLVDAAYYCVPTENYKVELSVEKLNERSDSSVDR